MAQLHDQGVSDQVLDYMQQTYLSAVCVMIKDSKTGIIALRGRTVFGTAGPITVGPTAGSWWTNEAMEIGEEAKEGNGMSQRVEEKSKLEERDQLQSTARENEL